MYICIYIYIYDTYTYEHASKKPETDEVCEWGEGTANDPDAAAALGLGQHRRVHFLPTRVDLLTRINILTE